VFVKVKLFENDGAED